ncbi:hypothetical protein GpartN1_g467.t1 [Galdieria partita]|uniref:Protein phosphatase n=1 Tax=Galdieria partita TaxID=83374 RepID=A0A9C7PQS2_9RHOD|nr:hypothetical protein GpartN1_g467.t1 [Galdieria partita]
MFIVHSRTILKSLKTNRLAKVIVLRNTIFPCVFHNKVLQRHAAARFSNLTSLVSGGSLSTEKSKRSQLCFVTGSCCIPHFEKRQTGGEDAYFTTPKAVGVFDGVGGWASLGINAGLYSARLAELTQAKVKELGPCEVLKALGYAVTCNDQIGSSTAIVVGICEDRALGVSVGDSGLVIFRDGNLIFKTVEQQHYFNCPYQLGTDSNDTLHMGQKIDIPLRVGDILVLGTDGLFDNLFDEDIKLAVERTKAFHPNDAAMFLAKKALTCSLDTKRDGPFAVNSKKAGYLFLGGKADDITVLVCRVESL